MFFFLMDRDLGVGLAGVVARTSVGIPRAFPHLPSWLLYLLFREAWPPFALEPWQVEAACLGLDMREAEPQKCCGLRDRGGRTGPSRAC